MSDNNEQSSSGPDDGEFCPFSAVSVLFFFKYEADLYV